VWASFRASRRRDRSTFEELAVLEGSEMAVVEKKSDRSGRDDDDRDAE
jgi:hypothetical protein